MCQWRVRNSQDQRGAQGGTSEPLGLSWSRERLSSSSSSPYLLVCSIYLWKSEVGGKNWRRIQADGVPLTGRKSKTDTSIVVASTFANTSMICHHLCVKAMQQYIDRWSLHNTGSAADLLERKPDNVGKMVQCTTFTQWWWTGQSFQITNTALVTFLWLHDVSGCFWWLGQPGYKEILPFLRA